MRRSIFSSCIAVVVFFCVSASAQSEDQFEPPKEGEARGAAVSPDPPDPPGSAASPATAPVAAPVAGGPAPVAAGVAVGAAETTESNGASPLERWKVVAGGRGTYVASRGFDTFASNDVLGAFAVEGTYAFYREGKLAIGAGLGGDIGGRSDDMRGTTTDLGVYRVVVPIEARYAVLPWLWGLAKVAPGAAVLHGSMRDVSSSARLSDTAAAFVTDVAAGAAVVFGRRRASKVHFLVTPEVGYSFATRATLEPAPDREDDAILGRDNATRLAPLALNGVFWRLSLGVAF